MHKTLIAAIAALPLMAAPTPAQVHSPDAHVSLRVEGRTLDEIVQYLREVSGANIVVVQGAETEISLDLTDVLWRDALELASELAGCVVEERTAGVLVVDSPPRVDFVFDNAELTDVIDAIGAISGANIVVGQEVAGTISLRLKDVPWREALEVAVKTVGFTVVEDSRGILRVVDPLTLQAQMESRSYQLRYLRPPGQFVPKIKTEFADGEFDTPSGKVEDDFPIIPALRSALSPGGDLQYIDKQNVVIVKDTTQVHAEIKDMIDRMDIEPAQVFCDVKFVSTTGEEFDDLGVDYGELGPTIAASMGQIPIKTPFVLGAGGWDDSIIANDTGTGPFTDPSLNAGGTIVPDTIYGALNLTGVAATLRLIQEDRDAEVVQAPKVVTLDGVPATVFVGETVRYAEAKSEVGQTGSLQLSVQEAQGSPVDTGFQLLLVPHVIPGSNSVQLDVIPKETSLSGTSNSPLAPAGFDFFVVGAGGDAGSIALPRVRTSTIVTSMILESGQTAVVGGLSTDIDIDAVRKIPLLGDIPIIGWLFKNEQQTKERRNLLVFLSPQIVRTSSDTQDILERELDRRRAIYQDQFDRLLSDINPEPTEAAAPADEGAPSDS
jgi:type IV pilus assembly protein PilQ